MDAPSLPVNPLFARIQAAVDQFGHPPQTQTKSRRHGHQPRAKEHVENYLAHKVLGQSIRSIASSLNKAPSTVAASVRRGESIVKAGSEAKGFLDPIGRRIERDPDADRGFSDPWADDD